jgi:nuclear RNA export factor
LEAIQKAISNTRDSQVNLRQGKTNAASNLEPFSVRGWKTSKVSSHRDGGVENLVAFLERRMNASTKSGPRARITKVCSTSEGAITNHQSRHFPIRSFLCFSKDGGSAATVL